MEEYGMLLRKSLTDEERSRIPKGFLKEEFSFNAMAYPFKATQYFFKQQLWKLCPVEMIVWIIIILILFFLIVIQVFVEIISFLNGSFSSTAGTNTFGVISAIINILIALNCLVIIVYSFVIMYNSYRRLSISTENLMTGGYKEVSFGPLNECSKFSLTFALSTIIEIIIIIPLLFIILPVSLLPFVGQVLFLFLCAVYSSYSAFKIIFIKEGKFGQIFNFISNNFLLCLGYGAGLVLIGLIPGSIFIYPFIVPVATTRLWLHFMDYKNERKSRIKEVTNTQFTYEPQIPSKNPIRQTPYQQM